MYLQAGCVDAELELCRTHQETLIRLLRRYCYLCTLCTQQHGFMTRGEYLRHLASSSGSTKWMTAVARSRSATMRLCIDAVWHKCVTCGLVTTNADLFCEHMRCHLTSEPYACSRCQTTWSTPLNG